MSPRFARHACVPFERWIKPRFAGKPIRYLELGVFQGASAKWMFENVLTHQNSKADLVDPWMSYEADPKHIYTQEAMEAAAKSVLEYTAQYIGRCWVFRQKSDEYLANLGNGIRYDLVYQDGAHDGQTVLKDAIALMDVVKIGGWIVFDDCNEAGVRKGVNAFADVFEERLAPVYATKQQRCFEVRSRDGEDG